MTISSAAMNPPAHRHPRIRAVGGDSIMYECGCINHLHSSGILWSLSKCDVHRAQQHSPAAMDCAYYERLGAIVDGVPQCPRYLAQLQEALGSIPPPGWSGRKHALEIGCGCSMYAPGILRAGYHYHGVDPSPWAARWTSFAFDAPVQCCSFKEYKGSPGLYSFILAAHVFEHLDDAPTAFHRCAMFLRPGGRLWLIVPDDSDPLNPDHLWFFTKASLTACLENAGFLVEQLVVRKYVERENFVYCAAVKRGN